MKKARAIVLIGLVGLALAGCQAASPEQGGRGRLIGDEPMVQKVVVVGYTADKALADSHSASRQKPV